MKRDEFNLLEKEMIEAGYKQQGPGGEREDIDAGICQKAKCQKCGHKGLDYRPLWKAGESYRAFAVCPKCGEAREL